MDDIPVGPAPERYKSAKESKPATTKSSKGAAPAPPAGDDHRRGFLSQALAVVIGGFVGLVPMAAGLMTFIDPLRRKSAAAKSIRVAPLHVLPADGTPASFPIVADREDAWNKFLNEQVGTVYLRRVTAADGTVKVQALNASCPHAGCMVAFKSDSRTYRCPCHDSSFQLDGERINPESCPAPRGLDELECELTTGGNEQEVMVKFVNYYAGMAEKKPKT